MSATPTPPHDRAGVNAAVPGPGRVGPIVSRRAPRWRSLAWTGLLALAYLWAFPYHAQVNNPNENVRYYMTVAIVEHGTFAIEQVERAWGWVNDKAVYGGHLYSLKSPGTSYLGVPGYAAYRALAHALGGQPDRTTGLWIVRLTATILPMLALAYVFHRFVARRTSDLAADVALVAAFLGSNLYGYGMLFVSHATSAVAAFGAFVAARRVEEIVRAGRPPPIGLLVLAGLLPPAVTAFEYPGFAATVALLVYSVWATRAWRRRGDGRRPWARLAWLALGAALPTALVMLFQWRAFGSPLRPGHVFAETEAFRDWHHQGFYGTSFVPRPVAMGTLLFSPECGLFTWTPFALPAVAGFVLAIRRRGRRALGVAALAAPLLLYLLISSMLMWRGGWTIGPRFLSETLPFCAFGTAIVIDALARRLRARLAALAVGGVGLGLAIASVIASAVPSAWYPHVPEEVTHPLPQLYAYLLRDGFAPHNVGRSLFGLEGSAGMVPLVALWVSALVACAWSASKLGALSGARRAFAAAAVLGLAVPVGLAAAYPVLRSPDVPDGPLLQWRREITSSWAPEGRDDLSRERARLEADPHAEPSAWYALAERWEELGRYPDADRARASGRGAERRRALRR